MLIGVIVAFPEYIYIYIYIYIHYSKFAKGHFFDVRYFVPIITIYNQIDTKGKSMFGPHQLVMQLLI